MGLWGNLTLGYCMDIIILDNLTLGIYTLVTVTLSNLALSHTAGTQVLQQK